MHSSRVCVIIPLLNLTGNQDSGAAKCASKCCLPCPCQFTGIEGIGFCDSQSVKVEANSASAQPEERGIPGFGSCSSHCEEDEESGQADSTVIETAHCAGIKGSRKRPTDTYPSPLASSTVP